jgi:hypothetical protein
VLIKQGETLVQSTQEVLGQLVEELNNAEIAAAAAYLLDRVALNNDTWKVFWEGINPVFRKEITRSIMSNPQKR